MITEKDKNKIIYVVQAVIPEAKIYLFGSHATGHAKENSDIDIAVEANKEISRFEIAEIKNMLENSRIMKKIDVVDINSLDDLEFKNEILRTRIPWKI